MLLKIYQHISHIRCSIMRFHNDCRYVKLSIYKECWYVKLSIYKECWYIKIVDILRMSTHKNVT